MNANNKIDFLNIYIIQYIYIIVYVVANPSNLINQKPYIRILIDDYLLRPNL